MDDNRPRRSLIARIFLFWAEFLSDFFSGFGHTVQMAFAFGLMIFGGGLFLFDVSAIVLIVGIFVSGGMLLLFLNGQ